MKCLIKVLRSCEFSPHAITLGAFCQAPPRKIHKTSYKTKNLINIGYETPLDIQVGDLYNNRVRDSHLRDPCTKTSSSSTTSSIQQISTRCTHTRCVNITSIIIIIIIINTRCMIPTRWMMSTHEIHTMCRNSHIVIMHNHVRDMCVYTYHNTCYNIRTHRILESCTHTNA